MLTESLGATIGESSTAVSVGSPTMGAGSMCAADEMSCKAAVNGMLQ